MKVPTKLTNSSEETPFQGLFKGDNIFSIPYFQRPYKWERKKNLVPLENDFLNIVDTKEPHFLGAIILHGRRSHPNEPDQYEIIDGQQRITTVFLYICAAVKVLAKNNELRTAKQLLQKYLVLVTDTDTPTNIKLIPSKEDRASLNNVFKDLLKNSKLKNSLGDQQIRFLPDSGKPKGRIWLNYLQAQRFLTDNLEADGLARVNSIYTVMLDFTNIVLIDVTDPTNGPKIFDGLNSKQKPMTIGDLVRNEIFSRVSNETPDIIDNLDEHFWQPFYKKFDVGSKNFFDEYFFPFGLTQNPNLTKSEVFPALREHWQSRKDPETIIDLLSEYQNAFIDIQSGSNLQRLAKPVADAFLRITRSKPPTSTYPFLMQLSNAIVNRSVNQKDALDVLELIEAFLVRRAVTGHEPTGLHAVFKRLWGDCQKRPTLTKVKAAIKKHKTVAYPDDVDFAKAISSRPLYGVGITPYVLMEYDSFLGGDQPKNIPWVEHVLPVTMAGLWKKDFTSDEHGEMVHCLANLIPLSAKMNMSLSNKPYSAKMSRYGKDSMFKSTRKFAETYKTWTPDDFRKRAKVLSKWAIKRWST